MQRPISIYISTFLFLVTFLAPRVANLHALDHFSDDEDSISCELCDITSSSQQFDLYLGHTPSQTDYILNYPSPYVVDSFYNSPTAKIASPSSIYNKPPPVL
ncbi:hypothetical protein NBT05_17415 [Aquimarina sp. ERC-38]|uniref:hypothetical protein n=1 Tax=Aquimarina sp. ERC-38 TaxID=2949996 RepID=UPI0022459DFF|nr:hypothetical protein [Aquimarina sp. ERC-38]UZO80708.1 hypothetical protein NBT05_17415 [Aquimarina sp. ERC-38]